MKRPGKSCVGCAMTQSFTSKQTSVENSTVRDVKQTASNFRTLNRSNKKFKVVVSFLCGFQSISTFCYLHINSDC